MGCTHCLKQISEAIQRHAGERFGALMNALPVAGKQPCSFQLLVSCNAKPAFVRPTYHWRLVRGADSCVQELHVQDTDESAILRANPCLLKPCLALKHTLCHRADTYARRITCLQSMAEPIEIYLVTPDCFTELQAQTNLGLPIFTKLVLN